MLSLAILRLAESFFRRPWLYLLPIVLAIGVGAATVFTAPREFRASGRIFVQDQSFLSALTSVRDEGFSWQTQAQLASNQFNELLRTDAFVRAVIQETDLEERMDKGTIVVDETIKEVRESVWIFAVGDSHIEVAAQHEDPLLAFQLADGAIKTYTQWQINADRNESVAAEGFLDELIVTYRADLDEARAALESYLIAHPEPLRGDRPVLEELEIERLQGEIDLAQTRYSNALGKHEDARLATAQAERDIRQRFMLIDAPRIPTSSQRSLRQMAMSLATFAGVGVLISFGMIFSGAVLDQTVRFPVDVRQLLHLDVLAAVPRADDILPQAREESKESAAEPVSKETDDEATTAQPAAAD